MGLRRQVVPFESGKPGGPFARIWVLYGIDGRHYRQPRQPLVKSPFNLALRPRARYFSFDPVLCSLDPDTSCSQLLPSDRRDILLPPVDLQPPARPRGDRA